MRAARAALVVIGIAIGAYGVVLLFENPIEVMVRIAVWAVVGAVLHDFVFAPVAAALGLAGRRLFHRRWWTPVSVSGLCSCVLVLLAIPVYTRPGAHADNMTVVDRDYPRGFWIAIGIVWACVPLYHLLSRLLPVRQDEVVERQRADDVESQPPPV